MVMFEVAPILVSLDASFGNVVWYVHIGNMFSKGFDMLFKEELLEDQKVETYFFCEYYVFEKKHRQNLPTCCIR